MKKFITFLGVIVVLLLIAVGCFFGIKIKTIKVSGSTIYSEKEVIEAQMDEEFSYNSMYLFMKYKMKGPNSMPFARKIEYHFNSPVSLNISVYDKDVSACVYSMNQYAYVDNEGVVIECTPATMDAVTVITGVEVNSFTVGEKLGVEDKSVLSRLINLTMLIKYYELPVKELKTKDEEIIMQVKGIKVIFGNKDYYDDDMAALSSVLEKAFKRNLKGTIDMKDYMAGDKIILQP